MSDIREFRDKEKIRIDGFIGCFMSFRRQLFDKIGYFDEWIGTQLMAAGEDFEFCQRALIGGYGLFLNPQITTLHLGAREGGCSRRSTVVEEVESIQLRLGLYAVLKNRKYRGWLGWVHALARCYRSAILNRNLISSPASLARKHVQFWKASHEALRVLRSRPKPEVAVVAVPQRNG